MPYIRYKEINFKPQSLALIDVINDVLGEYQAAGYELTLRQAYYQLVARDHIPNTERSYKNVGALINNGRLAGLIDWGLITDRTRNLRSASHWDGPSQIVDACIAQYRIDRWEGQPNYVEVWVEKDALVDIVAKACNPLDVPYFSCRGYTSQSEMWAAARRFMRRSDEGKGCYIVHLGDHDPSGVDMSRDIQERLLMFGTPVRVERIALTMEQIEEFSPPPNPAKLSDSRCGSYISRYGRRSWELDALEPQVIRSLITEAVAGLRDDALMDEALEAEGSHIRALERLRGALLGDGR